MEELFYDLFFVADDQCLLVGEEHQLQCSQFPAEHRFLEYLEIAILIAHTAEPQLHFLEQPHLPIPILLFLPNPKPRIDNNPRQLLRQIKLQLLGNITQHDTQIMTTMRDGLNERMLEQAAD